MAVGNWPVVRERRAKDHQRQGIDSNSDRGLRHSLRWFDQRKDCHHVGSIDARWLLSYRAWHGTRILLAVLRPQSFHKSSFYHCTFRGHLLALNLFPPARQLSATATLMPCYLMCDLK